MYFDRTQIIDTPPNPSGKQILAIWNARVDDVRAKFKEVRTVVLIKSNDLRELAIFEFETVRYPPDLFEWVWNKRGNLEGFNEAKEHIFTWQPHGSQFTIIEEVSQTRLAIRIKKVPRFSKEKVLESVGFDDSWIEIMD